MSPRGHEAGAWDGVLKSGGLHFPPAARPTARGGGAWHVELEAIHDKGQTANPGAGTVTDAP